MPITDQREGGRPLPDRRRVQHQAGPVNFTQASQSVAELVDAARRRRRAFTWFGHRRIDVDRPHLRILQVLV